MGIDLDPLDDIFAEEGVKNARPLGKFQPKAKSKFLPKKKASVAPSVSSAPPPQTVDTAADELSNLVETTMPSENCREVLNDKEGGCASIEKSVAENVDIFVGLEALGDIITNNTTDMVGTTPPIEVPNPENAEAQDLQVPASVEDATYNSRDDVPACPELSEALEPLASGEPIVSSGNGYDQMDGGELHREETDITDSVYQSELTTKSEQRRGKFQPKRKIQMQKGIYEASESVPCPLVSQPVETESAFAEKDSVPTFQQDDMLDLSDLGFTHSMATDVAPEIPLTEESVNHMEVTQIDSGITQINSGIHLDVVPEAPAKLASRRANTGRDKTETASAHSPQQKQASTSAEGNGMQRILRPRKSKANLFELVDEVDEEVLAGGDISDEIPINSAVEEENVLNEESQPENESQKKKVKQKPKKPDDDKEKPARKRKKAEDGAKPKKFSHSTRRRRVDKALLETPEDEIDYQKLPLRDLILLAEHKEKQTKKEEAAAGATAKSNGNSSSHRNEDETLNSRQDAEYNDGQDIPGMEDTTVFFNYQSHMDKTPATRWTKQETELFYEAVRQFGTDLSMIQQLFPDRTRRQVKLKYKKEERQHPSRLREALTTRSKDHSHFRNVIERLQKMAAEENQNVDNSDSIDLTGNEVDEETSNVDKEETKDEQIGEEEKVDAANDIDVQSPSTFEDNEDDLSIWSQYKSDN